MPFDGSDFPERPGRPRRMITDDDVISLVIVAVSVGALLLPVSITGFADIVHYIQGR